MADPNSKWEYLARNLKKIIGPGMESDFNKLGREGWEFVAVAKDYAIFKRRLAEQEQMKEISDKGSEAQWEDEGGR
jgi:hypothetical protein